MVIDLGKYHKFGFGGILPFGLHTMDLGWISVFSLEFVTKLIVLDAPTRVLGPYTTCIHKLVHVYTTPDGLYTRIRAHTGVYAHIRLTAS